MSHKALRFTASRMVNTPHLVHQEEFDRVMEYLSHRNESNEMAVKTDIERAKANRLLTEGDVSVIQVSGPLTYESTWLTAVCGMSSYQGMVQDMAEVVARGSKICVLDVDSGGGEAYGCFETAIQIKQMAVDNDIKLIAYVDGAAYSAAYALTSVADEVIMNPDSEAGSIGVLTRLVNLSEKNKKDGIEVTYIHAGENKIPFDADGNFREDFLSDIQTKVDKLYTKFISHVATNRELSEEDVQATQASTYTAEDAVSLGLADKTMTRVEFANYLADTVKEMKTMPLHTFLTSKNKEEAMADKPTPEITAPEAPKPEASALTGQMSELQAQLQALQNENKAMREAADNKARAELATDLSKFSFAKDQSTQLAGILFGMDATDKQLIMDVLESADMAVSEASSMVAAVEGESEEDLTSDEDKEKASTREVIKAKYSKE